MYIHMSLSGVWVYPAMRDLVCGCAQPIYKIWQQCGHWNFWQCAVKLVECVPAASEGGQ